MKHLIATSLLTVCLAQTTLGEARSVHEKIFAPDFLSSHQIIDINNEGKESITLNSHFTTTQADLVQLPHQLENSAARSIVIFHSKADLDDLQPQLKKAILDSIGGSKNFDRFYIFANFEHERPGADQSEHFIAIIDKKVMVEKVTLQMRWFGDGLGGQAQLRFTLDRAFTAIPQISDAYLPQEVQIAGKADLIFSTQSLSSQRFDIPNDPLHGLLGEFANALRLVSTQALARQQIGNSLIKEYEILRLSEKEKKYLFLTSLDRSHQMQESGIYNTVFNNSISEVLRVLKSVSKINSDSTLANVNSGWFNPHTLLPNLFRAHPGGFQLTGSLNDQFGFLVKQEPIGVEHIRQTAGFKVTQKFRRHILESEKFDAFMVQVAQYLIDKKVTSDQLQNFLQEAGKSSPKLSTEGRNFVTACKKLWSNHFRYETFDNFLDSFPALKNQ